MLYINDELDKISDDDVKEIIDTFPTQRREQALKFKFALGRKECAVAYMLLCKGLREKYGMEEMPVFEYGEHGKPSIIGHEEIHFNMSHCKRAVVCAVGSEPVGVDVECIGRGNDSLIDYTMNDDEVLRIKEAENPNTEFIRLWTQKEALLKLTGEGINDDIKSVLSAENMSRVRIETFVNEEKGYVYSLAHFTTVL